jgi:PIN domain nuclease of toxin-antitoxin system
MNYLLDTHLLIWLALDPHRLAADLMVKLENPDNLLYFSAVGPWEIAVKRALGRQDFDVDPDDLTKKLIDNGWNELPLTSQHGIAAGALPAHHRDPFDRAMIGQAAVEHFVFLTADRTLAAYGDPVELV